MTQRSWLSPCGNASALEALAAVDRLEEVDVVDPDRSWIDRICMNMGVIPAASGEAVVGAGQAPGPAAIVAAIETTSVSGRSHQRPDPFWPSG